MIILFCDQQTFYVLKDVIQQYVSPLKHVIQQYVSPLIASMQGEVQGEKCRKAYKIEIWLTIGSTTKIKRRKANRLEQKGIRTESNLSVDTYGCG